VSRTGGDIAELCQEVHPKPVVVRREVHCPSASPVIAFRDVAGQNSVAMMTPL
jgi:hypothetical protein